METAIWRGVVDLDHNLPPRRQLEKGWDLVGWDLEGWDLEGWDPAAANGMPIRQKLPADSELLGAE